MNKTQLFEERYRNKQNKEGFKNYNKIITKSKKDKKITKAKAI